jgi:hypothetical protein
MTHMKINKVLESRGGNFITLERITLDERASAEKRPTAYLAINKRYIDHIVQALYQEVESNDVLIEVDSNNELIEEAF